MASFKRVSKHSHSQGGLSTINTVVTNKFILSGTGHGQFGISNTIGPTGLTGPTGPDGNTGPFGPNYPTGATGATGPTGPTGFIQPTGATGWAGDTGIVGPARCAIDGSGAISSYTSGADPDGKDDYGSLNMDPTFLGEYAFIPGQPILLTGNSGQETTAVITDTVVGSLTPSIDFSNVLILVAPTLGPPDAVDVKLQGDIGVIGYTGPTGYTGITGPSGFTGPTGYTGPTGWTGPSYTTADAGYMPPSVPLAPVQFADGVVLMYTGAVSSRSVGLYTWQIPAHSNARRWYICDGSTISTSDGATTRILPDISNNTLPVGATGSAGYASATPQNGPSDADGTGSLSCADGIPVYMHDHDLLAGAEYGAAIGVYPGFVGATDFVGVSSTISSFNYRSGDAAEPVDENGADLGGNHDLWTATGNTNTGSYGSLASQGAQAANSGDGLGTPGCFAFTAGLNTAPGGVASTAGFLYQNASSNDAVSHVHQYQFDEPNGEWLIKLPLEQSVLWEQQNSSGDNSFFNMTTDAPAADASSISLEYNHGNGATSDWGRTDGATGTSSHTLMKHTPIYFITYYEGFEW